MEKREAEELIKALKWDVNEDEQKIAFDKLAYIEPELVEVLLQPINKDYWENAAKVLKLIGYPRNKLAIPGLLEWLQDMNWPGAIEAKEALMEVEKNILIPYIEKALLNAKEQDDTVWIAWIKELIIELHITEQDFSDIQNYKILELAEW